jgi:hypothetical protein
MQPFHEYLLQSRRSFLATSANGIGMLALAALLKDEGLLAAESMMPDAANPLAPKAPHFAPRAKACICIYLEGAPSQIDLFDPKPKLNQLNGQKLPESMTKNVRFAFIRKEGAVLMGSPRKFTKHGQCGMDISDFLPNLATCADDIALIRSMYTESFNHHPGQLAMNTGVPMFGRPSMGSWLNYGLGSESKSLPGYVVLTAGRGTSGGATNWSSGFLPSTYAGVLFRNQGEPVLNLNNPSGLTDEMQRQTIEALRDLNGQRHAQIGDPEINSRISAYELAFRMQMSAPELITLAGETRQTLEAYGVSRPEPDTKAARGGGKGQFHQFALNCLLARRMVERGVRFINLYHASWDHHSNLNQELGHNCLMADQPIAALLKDLKQRGLLDTTLVMWLSEFGRTPLGENRVGYKEVTGRDHHPFAFTIWMAGGGIKGGQVIGKTDEIGWNIVEDPIHINDFHATLLRLFGMDHLKLTYRFQGRDFRLTDVGGKVVKKLLA